MCLFQIFANFNATTLEFLNHRKMLERVYKDVYNLEKGSTVTCAIVKKNAVMNICFDKLRDKLAILIKSAFVKII